jgi:hypothetical protein
LLFLTLDLLILVLKFLELGGLELILEDLLCENLGLLYEKLVGA